MQTQREAARAIEHDCERTLVRFYDCFDAWDYAGMLALCTPDCLWHRAGKDLAGHALILAELQKRTTTQTVRHVLSNVLVDARDASHASLKCLLTAYRYDDGTKRTSPPLIHKPILLLVVTAELVREGEAWLISRQVMKREFLFEEGL